MASKIGKILVVDDNLGIRLSLARQIMRQHNGSIDLIRSDVNQTVFQLIFR